MVIGNLVFQLPAVAAYGVGFILASWLAVVLLLMKSQRLQQSGAIVFTPNPFPFGVFATILGASLVGLGVGSSDFGFLVCLIIPLLVGALLTLMQAPALTITVASEQGLASYGVFTSRTLRWAEVDWVYGRQATAMGRNRRTVSLNQRTVMDRQLIVEAGRGHRITIALQSGGDQRIANELLKIITAHTAHAFHGERQLAAVRAARSR